MKTRVLKASLPLAALSLAFSSTEVGAASIRGSILRNGPMDELASEIIHAENIQRRLQGDENDNGEGDRNDNVGEEGDAEEVEEEEVEEEEEVAEYDYEYEYGSDGSYESWETEDMQYADESEGSSTTIMAKVQQYEDEAQQLFETAPAQWNAGQWDLLFALFGSVLVSCCVLSAFFAYCCIFREDDDVYGKKGRSLRKRRSNKGKNDDITEASEYTKDASLLPTSTRTGFSPRSWVSGTAYFSSNDEEDRKGKKKYSAPRAVDVTSPTHTVTSIGFASVNEGDIIHQDTGVTPKSQILHQQSGKSEVVEM